MGDAHEQSRLRSERSHAGPKRALCVQSVRVPVATELLSPLRLRLSVVLRLWTRLLRLWSKLLRLRTKLPVLPLKPLRAGSLNLCNRRAVLAGTSLILSRRSEGVAGRTESKGPPSVPGGPKPGWVCSARLPFLTRQCHASGRGPSLR